MIPVSVAIAWLVAVTSIAIVATYVATRWALGRRFDREHAAGVQLDQTMDADQRLAGRTATGLTLTTAGDVSVETVSPAGRVPADRAARVLVVEDEPGMREFIRLVLVGVGHEVVMAAGAAAALAALNRQPTIALMLVDIIMPGMDGYELVAEARRTSPKIHVVFMSAFAPDPARKVIGDDFLAKPFTKEALIGIVEKALKV